MRSPNGAWPDGTDEARALAEQVAGEPGAVPPWARGRVWNRLVAQRAARRRSTWMRVSLGAALATCMALAVALLHPWSARSLAGTELVAGNEARLVDVRDEAHLALAPGTLARITADDDHGIAISIERGSLLADVNHRPANAVLVLNAPHAGVTVVGTLLWVSVA
jgi:hypothetical protein